MDESPWLGGSQTRVCDTGPQFTAISLFKCGSQRHSAIRTSRPRVSGLSGSDPETQRQQLLAAGVALSRIYQDVGVYGTSGTTFGGAGTLLTPGWPRATPWLWCPSTASGGASWTPLGTSTICNGAESEFAAWPITNSPGPSTWMPPPIRRSRSWGYTLAGFAAWVSDQELMSIRRRTKAGLEKARAAGKKLGAPRRLSEEQEATIIEMVASGVSQRRVARSFGVSPATVRRTVKRE